MTHPRFGGKRPPCPRRPRKPSKEWRPPDCNETFDIGPGLDEAPGELAPVLDLAPKGHPNVRSLPSSSRISEAYLKQKGLTPKARAPPVAGFAASPDHEDEPDSPCVQRERRRRQTEVCADNGFDQVMPLSKNEDWHIELFGLWEGSDGESASDPGHEGEPGSPCTKRNLRRLETKGASDRLANLRPAPPDAKRPPPPRTPGKSEGGWRQPVYDADIDVGPGLEEPLAGLRQAMQMAFKKRPKVRAPPSSSRFNRAHWNAPAAVAPRGAGFSAPQGAAPDHEGEPDSPCVQRERRRRQSAGEGSQPYLSRYGPWIHGQPKLLKTAQFWTYIDQKWSLYI
ncbi:hypothetical protein DFP72DRAFT_855317 [Ephemerocybe angulata]|uniref:Uncharacterized protein n=1 Tax=Ephemerocybe angulata TaxID=980116 RepID=A0A8H6LXP2_9AGAR|nr:hypothetical protein DFP72DRAFT_855317 [Tulosesus angulatus]